MAFRTIVLWERPGIMNDAQLPVYVHRAYYVMMVWLFGI